MYWRPGASRLAASLLGGDRVERRATRGVADIPLGRTATAFTPGEPRSGSP